MKIAELEDGRIIMAKPDNSGDGLGIIRLNVYLDIHASEVVDTLDLRPSEAKNLITMINTCLGGTTP